MNTHKEMVEQLANSELFLEYESAFGAVTGLPLALRSMETLDLPFQGKHRENAFCAMMARKSQSCVGCLQIQEKLRKDAQEKVATATCIHDLNEAAVPVRIGDQVIGFLLTGQILIKKPSPAKIKQVVTFARQLGAVEEPGALSNAYLRTPVLSQETFHSTLQLLTIFAELLSIQSNQVVVRQSRAEPPAITTAKKIIQDRYAGKISLAQVAHEVHLSPFYLCKLFHNFTGLTFTEFVTRTRLEKATQLLLNPNLRISEIAYVVGFQSLTHFNRVFRKMMGETPTRYRMRLNGKKTLKVLPKA